jgi:hypothetical protein
VCVCACVSVCVCKCVCVCGCDVFLVAWGMTGEMWGLVGECVLGRGRRWTGERLWRKGGVGEVVRSQARCLR